MGQRHRENGDCMKDGIDRYFVHGAEQAGLRPGMELEPEQSTRTGRAARSREC
jgi:hypothetical protein